MNKDLFMLVTSLESDFCEWFNYAKSEDISEEIIIDENFKIIFPNYKHIGKGEFRDYLFVLLLVLSIGVFYLLCAYLSRFKPIIKIKDVEYTPTFVQGFKILQMKKRIVKRMKANHKQQQAEKSINFISKKYYECQD